MKGLGQVFKAVSSAMVGVGKKEDLVKDFERMGLYHCWFIDDRCLYWVGNFCC